MPKGARGSRGQSRGAPHHVQMGIRTLAAPRGWDRDMVKKAIIDSIDRGDYVLPDGLEISLRWSNSHGEVVKEDEFTNAMIDSGTNGRGWDKLVLKRLGVL